MRTISLMILAIALAACATPKQVVEASSLERSIDAACAAHPGGEVSVAYRNLSSGKTYLMDASKAMHAASTMKIPVMLEAFVQSERENGLQLDTPIRVKNSFRSIVDGSSYRLTPDDDGEQDLYSKVGQSLPLRELVRRMMVRSSNLATNILVEKLGSAHIQQTIDAYRVAQTKILRGVEDIPAYRAGLNNETSARDLLRVLEVIYVGRDFSQASRDEMMAILEAQEFNDLIPAGLPEGVRVAHKTGSITEIQHDAAIVMPEGQAHYILVVLTRGFADPAEAKAAIAEVSRAVFEQAKR